MCEYSANSFVMLNRNKHGGVLVKIGEEVMKNLKTIKGLLISWAFVSSLCASGPESLAYPKLPEVGHWYRIEAVHELLNSQSFRDQNDSCVAISNICRDIARDPTLTSLGMLELAKIFNTVGDKAGMQTMIRRIREEGDDYEQDAVLRQEVRVLLSNRPEKTFQGRAHKGFEF